MQINRRVNHETPRGAGNIKGWGYPKNHRKQGHRVLYVKRINAIGDLTGYDLIETPETKKIFTADRAKRFGKQFDDYRCTTLKKTLSLFLAI